jgi:glyoxylase I family protein
MFTVKSIDHIVLKTNHITQMLEFYCKVLGGVVERTLPAISLTQIRLGDNLIDLIEVEHALELHHQNLDHFCLRITPFDLDPLKKYFAQHNIEITEEGMRYGAQGMGYSIYIKDPQGTGVELREIK